MDAKYCSENIFKTAQTIAQHLIRYLGIGVLAAIISISSANKVQATYMLSDFNRASNYFDNQQYHYLDYGQYRYLDRGQYNVIGKLDYFLGFPHYPKLYDKELDQSVGFTNIVNKGRYAFWGEQVPIIRYALWSTYDFSNKDYFYNSPYYFSDKGQYNYPEKKQYDFLGGLTYSFNRSNLRNQFEAGTKTSNVVTNPEPSTIVLFGLGALAVLRLRKKNRTK